MYKECQIVEILALYLSYRNDLSTKGAKNLYTAKISARTVYL
jgi:hypothetical protein